MTSKTDYPSSFQCDQCGNKFTRYYNTAICPDCKLKNQENIQRQFVAGSIADENDKSKERWDINLPGRWNDIGLSGFEKFNSSLQPKAFNAIKNWQSGQSIVLFSPGIYGVGKTHLVACLVWHLYDQSPGAVISQDGLTITRKRCPVRFETENELLRRTRTTFQKDATETEDSIYKSLSYYPLLVIDDVGKIRPRDLSFTQSVYFNIIDQRYSDGDDIILTSNLDLDGIEEHIGGACADRLREMCGKSGFIKMTGQSYRKR